MEGKRARSFRKGIEMVKTRYKKKQRTRGPQEKPRTQEGAAEGGGYKARRGDVEELEGKAARQSDRDRL